MPRYILDSNHFTFYSQQHPKLCQRINSEPAGNIVLSVVCVEEALRGRLNAIGRLVHGGNKLLAAYRWMRWDLELIQRFPLVDYDTIADDQFQNLTHLTTASGVKDMRIAAIAFVNNLVLLTTNRRDFTGVPGLVTEDWTL